MILKLSKELYYASGNIFLANRSLLNVCLFTLFTSSIAEKIKCFPEVSCNVVGCTFSCNKLWLPAIDISRFACENLLKMKSFSYIVTVFILSAREAIFLSLDGLQGLLVFER